MKLNLRKVKTITAIILLVVMASCEQDNINPAISGLSSVKNESVEQNNSARLLFETVNLGISGEFAILSKSGITDVYKSDVTGDIGSSPITGAAILLSCSEVAGTIYSVDAAGPLPCRVTDATRLSIAVANMQTAYTDLAGRINPDFLNLGAGDIGGKTLTAGLYKWTSPLIIPTDIAISGSPDDIFIFQVDQTLSVSSAVNITLIGGAQAKNIFWVTGGAVTLGTTSHFEGNILGQTSISLLTGASINGRLLAQTAVTLEMNTVVQPL